MRRTKRRKAFQPLVFLPSNKKIIELATELNHNAANYIQSSRFMSMCNFSDTSRQFFEVHRYRLCLADLRVFWLSTIEISNQVVDQLPRRDFEADDRIDEIQLVIISEKNVVAILPDICNKEKFIPKLISSFSHQSQGYEMIFNLLVVRTSLGSYGILTINQTGLTPVLAHTEELKLRLREKNIMNDMLVNRIANIMPLQMRLGKRVLDLVVHLLALNHTDFTLARSHGITRTRNRFRFKQTIGYLRRSNQTAALTEYRILRLAPNISASFIGKRLFKHSDAAEIRKRSLSRGRERMKDATVTSVPSR